MKKENVRVGQQVVLKKKYRDRAKAPFFIYLGKKSYDFGENTVDKTLCLQVKKLRLSLLTLMVMCH